MTIVALLLFLQVRVVVLDANLPREWVSVVQTESENLHGTRFLPTRYRLDPLRGSLMSWSDKSERISRMKRSKLHRYMKRRGGYAVHYMLPVTSESYIGGVAYVGGDISIGFYTPSFRGYGTPWAITTMIHEIGHTRCMWHTDTEDIMNTLALHFPTQPRTWAPISLKQARQCRR